jgi:hypothetical protein
MPNKSETFMPNNSESDSDALRIEVLQQRVIKDISTRILIHCSYCLAHVDGRDVAPHGPASMAPARQDLQMPKPAPLARINPAVVVRVFNSAPLSSTEEKGVSALP